MTAIGPSDLLSHTLNIIQLARETAAAKGNAAQAARFAPVAENLKELVQAQRASSPAPAYSGVMAQPDFQTLRSLSVKSAGVVPPVIAPVASASTALDRNGIVTAMASGGMSATDIARHMGMTLEEVRLIVDVSRKNNPGLEAIR